MPPPPLPFKPILLNRSPVTRPIQRHSTLAYIKPHSSNKNSQISVKRPMMPKLLGSKYLKNSSQFQISIDNKSLNSIIVGKNVEASTKKQLSSKKIAASASNTRFEHHQSSFYFNERNSSLTSSQYQATPSSQNQLQNQELKDPNQQKSRQKFIKTNCSKLRNQQFLLTNEEEQHYTTNYAQTSKHKNFKQKLFEQHSQKPIIQKTLRLSMLLDSSSAICQNQQYQFQNSSIDLSDSKLK